MLIIRTDTITRRIEVDAQDKELGNEAAHAIADEYLVKIDGKYALQDWYFNGTERTSSNRVFVNYVAI